MCGCGQSDHHQFTTDHHMIDEYDDGSFDQLFERHRQETDDIGEAFTLVEKEIVKELLWLRINAAGRESSKSRRKSPSSHDDDYEEEVEVEEAKGARILTGFVNRNNRSKTRKKKGRRKGKRMMNGSNRKRCSVLEDIDEEERARSSTSKRRKSTESRALNLGFDFSDEIKALIGEDGDKDFKLRIRKKLFQTDMNPHHDRFTMPCLQINEVENLLVGAEKTRICHGDGIGVTLVELGLSDERDSMLTSQLRLKQWDMANTSCYALRSSWNAVVVRNVAVLRRNDYVQIYSFRRNEELWLVLVKDSDHEEGRTDGVFGRRTLMEDGDGAN
ncbi:hypothetical protein OIU77_002240 [Salix suchowensis]|uniref:B3 domain-containing protein n=1 Tax=Salix suchowensis TaxID=1278906 RepID=A0ABQ9B6X3_9ROSI|nr:hypothetical protein OIU77_002240 [Salix suchowensis]